MPSYKAGLGHSGVPRELAQLDLRPASTPYRAAIVRELRDQYRERQRAALTARAGMDIKGRSLTVAVLMLPHRRGSEKNET